MNKFAAITAGDDPSVRNNLLALYFGLFNKLLHQNEVKVDPVEAMKKLKKDRTLSKKDRIKQIKKLTKKKGSELDEEDNKVIELVLRGINIIIIKTSDTKELQKILTDQTDILFKLSHHKVLRIQLQVL